MVRTWLGVFGSVLLFPTVVRAQSASFEQAPASDPSTCQPPCRSGYLCLEGQCVTRCNPPCAADERCTDVGECVFRSAQESPVHAPAPAPAAPVPVAPPPAVPPATPPAAPGPQPSQDPPTPGGFERQGLVLAPRFGFLLTGSGEFEAEQQLCDPACVSDRAKIDYDDESILRLGVDVLYHVVPQLRLGGTLQWVPEARRQTDDETSEYTLGQELGMFAVIEGVFGGEIAGAVRAFVGPNILFPGGDLERGMDDMEGLCFMASTEDTTCKTAFGPYVGLSFGVGAGLLAQVNEVVALRLDMTAQRIAFNGPEVDITTLDPLSYHFEMSWSGMRYWLGAGVEF